MFTYSCIKKHIVADWTSVDIYLTFYQYLVLT